MSHRCDPQDQPPASPQVTPTADVVPIAPGASSSNGKHTHAAADMAPGNGDIHVPKRDGSRRRVQRTRRLSWLPFARSSSQTQRPRSQSVQLPKATSASTVARSVISAPILRATTNVEVARTEGVKYNELTDLAFSQCTGQSPEGGESPHVQQSSGHPVISDFVRDTAILPNIAVKRGRMLRLGDVVRSKLRGPPLRRQSEKSLRSELAVGIDEPNTQALESGIARRRTEALNLYKVKIKGLTGNGHIRRKPVNDSKAAGPHQNQPLLADLTDSFLQDESAEQGDGDSAFGSLTRSFASAVDKLDFSSSRPHNIPFLRSRSSFFNSKKDKDGGERSEARRQMAGTSSLQSPSPSLPSSSPAATLPQGSPARRPTHQTSQDNPGSQTPPLSNLVFASEKNKYILPTQLTDPSLGRLHPLRMHPPFGMTTSPWQSSKANQPDQAINNHRTTSSPTQTRSPSRHSDDEEDTLSLSDAPMFSPSLGDLSQYARDTPNSKATYRSEPQGWKVRDETPVTTPTRPNQAGGQRRGVLKKSKSGINMFSRSKSVKISTMANSVATSRPSAATPSTPSPLSQRDLNRKESIEGEKTVKKSRSLHFGGLFKRPSEPDLASPIPRDLSVPFQPATPSPLRNVTRAHANNRRSVSGP